jgi:hypothetical protein
MNRYYVIRNGPLTGHSQELGIFLPTCSVYGSFVSWFLFIWTSLAVILRRYEKFLGKKSLNVPHT